MTGEGYLGLNLPVSGTLGLNVGKAARLGYSDSNRSDPTLRFNYINF